jgi:hypothetical protein
MGAHRDCYFSRLDHCFERYSNAVPRCAAVFLIAGVLPIVIGWGMYWIKKGASR